ncbi:alpha-tocopherol transfer protein-like [Brevipalpus obovatus]|uniref:alpha-tocopherol transfer protein-like n=1 Tax=Brevipalpus obovatus TaxID=246614 RepID=UPI003D9E53D6
MSQVIPIGAVEEAKIIFQFSCIVKEDEKLSKFSFPKWCLEFFSRVTHYNLEESRKYLLSYIDLVNSMPSVFVWSDKLYQVNQDQIHCISKASNAAGGKIILFRPGLCDLKTVSPFEAIHAAGINIWTEIALNPDVHHHGMEVIVDAKGTTFGHLWSVTLNQFKLSAALNNFVQEKIVTKVHMVNCNRVMRIAFELLRPFIKTEVFNQYVFYGEDLSKLYESCPKSSLPAEYGGTFDDDYTMDERMSRFEVSRPLLEALWEQVKQVD